MVRLECCIVTLQFCLCVQNHIAADGQYRRKLAVRVHAQSAKEAGNLLQSTVCSCNYGTTCDVSFYQV